MAPGAVSAPNEDCHCWRLGKSISARNHNDEIPSAIERESIGFEGSLISAAWSTLTAKRASDQAANG